MGFSTRFYSRRERLADRLLHRVAIVLAVAGVAGLLALAPAGADLPLRLSVGLYGAGLVGMLVCSALSNHDPHDTSPRRAFLERLDHAGILFMIAATYTPFMLQGLGGVWGWTLLAFIWSVAITGIVLKLFHPRPMTYRTSIALYLLLGWSVLPALQPLAHALPTPTLVLLVAGGALYSSGVLFYLWTRLPYHMVVWHGFVLAAAGCHYAAVLTGIVLQPVADLQ